MIAHGCTGDLGPKGLGQCSSTDTRKDKMNPVGHVRALFVALRRARRAVNVMYVGQHPVG